MARIMELRRLAVRIGCFVLLGTPALLLAQTSSHPNASRGFDADGLYDFSGIDSVNLFNLSNTLTIPIFSSKVNGSLGFGLTLYGSSNVWELVEVNVDDNDPPPDDQDPCWPWPGPERPRGEEASEGFFTAVCYDPDRTDNAGMGFAAHFGLLYPPQGGPGFLDNWIHVSSDGSTRKFYPKLHHNDTGTPASTCYARDGSYARLKVPSCVAGTGVTEAVLEFADGTYQRFTRSDPSSPFNPFALTSMHDRFGNSVTIDRSNPLHWLVREWISGSANHLRQHDIFFVDRPASGMKVIDRILVAAFGGTTAEYDLQYVDATIARNCKDQYHVPGASVTVTLLDKLVLPDGTAYSTGGVDGYHTACDEDWTGIAMADAPGVLKQLTLPTGGKLQWTWQRVRYSNSEAHGSWQTSVGVQKKAVVRPGSQPSEDRCYGVTNPPAGDLSACTWTYTWGDPQIPLGNERWTKFRTPAGDESVHWFDQSKTRDAVAGTGWEYGLPIKRSSPDPEDSTRYLSQLIYAGSASEGTLLRTVYVGYEKDTLPPWIQGQPEDWYDTNRRVRSQRTVYEDDVVSSVARSASTTWSDFDGLGNYRVETTNGNFDSGNVRTTSTRYNPFCVTTPSSCSPFPSTQPWILGTYDHVDVTEGGDTARRTFTFDMGLVNKTGFLKSVRTLMAGITPQNPDVFTLFCRDSGGNVTSELTYGGDRTPLTSVPSCDTGTPTSGWEYRVDHSYQYGARSASQIQGFTWKSLELTIDANTGLPSESKDSAGVPTTFVYDGMRRLTDARPGDGGSYGEEAWTHITYHLAQATPHVDVARCKPTATSCAPEDPPYGADLLTYDYFAFDDFGRLEREQKLLPGNVWNRRISYYDPQGRRTRLTSWWADGQPPANELPATVWSGFDPFGRPATVTLPDEKVTSYSYLGVRWTETRRNIAQTITGVESCTEHWEGSDRQGRLWRIEENQDCVGGAAASVTRYTYDEGNRLTKVEQRDDVGSAWDQVRNFSYDNRGFLLSEQHPELGASGNGTFSFCNYDSHGHAERKRNATCGAGTATWGLYFAHDKADRLLTIRQENTSGGQGVLLKQFTYDTATGAGAGKVATARRWNYLPAPFNTTYDITETYEYQGRAGRPSKRTTQVGTNAERWVVGAQYDFLGGYSRLDYPTCTQGSCGTGADTPARNVTFTYARGLLSAIPGWASSITYHPNLQLSTVDHTNSTTEYVTNDDDGMPRPKAMRVEDATPAILWQSGTYAFDGAGNVKSLAAPGGTDQFQYDRLSRLVRGKLGTVSPTADQTITFDGFGNVTQITTNGTGTSTPTSVGTNHLTTLGAKYDDAGSLTDWNGNHYSYDRLSSMTAWCGTWVGGQNPYCEPSAEQWAYVYTADDERMLAVKYGEARSTWTVRDFGGSVLTRDERYPSPTEDPQWTCPGGGVWVFCDGFESGNTAAWSSTSTGRNRKVSDYVWREGQLLGSETLGEIRRHFALDHLGSARLVTNDFGEVLAQHTYFPFGQEATSTAQDAEPMKFTGHERDLKSTPSNPADDLDYMKARYESPILGRFLSVDPAGGSVSRPQGWNRYAYAAGNPVKYRDPDGAEIELAAGGRAGSAKNMLVRMAMRPSGRAWLSAVARNSAFSLRVRDGSLNSAAQLQHQLKTSGKTTPYFGLTQVHTKTFAGGGFVHEGAVMTLDTSVIQQYHKDKSGVTTAGHEFFHTMAALTQQSLAQIEAGDEPSRESGPAEKAGTALLNEATDLSEDEAREFLDDLLAPSSAPQLENHGSLFGERMNCVREPIGRKGGNFCS